MRQINTSDKRFHNGNGRNEIGTIVTAEWLNAVQDELVNLVTSLGGRVDNNVSDQIATLLLAKLEEKSSKQHNHTMSDITGLSNALNTKAPLVSPHFSGVPTAPTASQTTNNTQIATTAFVKAAIAALVGSAPASLDTLNELATALNNNANFASTIVNQLAAKADKNILNILIGIPIPYPLVAVPDGCLSFKGQSFNQSQYPILAQRYPNRVLPDLRGEFIRGWDNGRNIDSGRQILSAQGDAIRNITGEVMGMHVGDVRGAFFRGGRNAVYHDGGTGHRGYIKFDASRSVPTASENRPRNVAFQYICIAG